MSNDYFNNLVELYRAIPQDCITEISEDKFCFSGVYSAGIAQIIQYLETNYSTEFAENFEDDFSLFDVGTHIFFECSLPKNEKGRFYKSLESLIDNRPSISQGQYSGSYYIIDMDFLGNEESFSNENSCQEIRKLKNMCLLILFLRKIIDNNKSNMINMILKSSVYGDCIVIDPKISIGIFNNIRNDFIFSENFYDLVDLSDKNFHRIEKIMLLKLAIAKYAYDKYRTINDIRIDSIANGWNEICEIYKNNLSAYLDNFSFEKTIQEISDEKLKFVKAIDGVIKESTTKILGTPLSLIAVLTAITVDKNFAITNIITIISLFVFALILTMSLNFQIKIKNDIYKQAEIVFNNYDNENDGEVKKKIRTARDEIFTTSQEFDKTILVFYVLSWLPLSLLILLLIHRAILSIC